MGDDVAWLHGGGLLGLSPQAPTSDRIAPLGNIRSLSSPSGGFCSCRGSIRKIREQSGRD
jgi:hypothetical protein